MAIKNQQITVTYIAWDTYLNQPKTGDVGNHTLRVIKDGTAAAPTNSASEVDSTNAPGVYKLTLSAAEMNYDTVVLAGKSSTAGVAIMPLTMITEMGRIDAAVSSRSTYAGADTSGTTTLLSRIGAALTITSGKVDVNDKTGFSLSSASVQAIWDALTSALTTANSIGKRIVDYLTGDIYARIGAPVGASISADIAGMPAATLDLTNGVETSITLRQALRLILAASAGKLSGANTTTITIRNVGDTKNRITATVDADGNRTAVTTDLT